MQDNRRDFTKNEKQVLFDEVYGRCPICGKSLLHRKNGRIYRNFEVAHIYPANPIPEEVTLLATEERLSNDVNDLKNVIAVCKTCHTKFDNPRTREEYRMWVQIKRNILEGNEVKNVYALFNLEEAIFSVIVTISNITVEEDLPPLSFTALKVDEKVNETLPYILKRRIEGNVIDYFEFIRNCFLDIDKTNPYKFSTIAAEIRSFYFKCMQINNNQQKVYYALIDWLDEKTNRISREACEILIAFFVQDCEVFS